ncbi:unnamed protein product [Caretta caretta]
MKSGAELKVDDGDILRADSPEGAELTIQVLTKPATLESEAEAAMFAMGVQWGMFTGDIKEREVYSVETFLNPNRRLTHINDGKLRATYDHVEMLNLTIPL